MAWVAIGASVTARKARGTSTIASMPLPQFEPIISAPAAVRTSAARLTDTPISVKKPRRARSNVVVAMAGTSGAAARAASTARWASSRSVMVSTQKRSTPASASARA